MPTYRHVADPLESLPVNTVVTGPAKRIPRKRGKPDYDGRVDPEDQVASCESIGPKETVDGIARRAQEALGTADAIRVLRWWATQPGGDTRFAKAADRLEAGR